MADKQKKESDTLKFQRKVVLSGLRSSQYVKKKYTLKKGVGHIPKTGSYVEVGGRMAAEKAADRNKGKNQKKNKAHNALSFAKKDHSREKRAAYIKENIQNDLAASYEEKSVRKTDTDGSVSAEKDADKAERMKKAAYIKEKLQRDIAAKKAASFSKSDDIPDNFQSPPGTETNGTAQAEKNEVSFENRFLGNSEHISENKYKSSLDSAEVRQAYKAKILEAQMNRRKDAVVMHSQAQTNAALISAEKAKMSALKNAEAEEFTRDNVVPGIEMAAGYISAVKNGDAVGMITQPAVSVIKNNMGSLGGITDSVSTISGAVQSSDSIGGAAVNAGTSLAAGKLRSAVSNYLFKPSDAKIEGRLEKKFRCIDRKTDRQMSRIQKEKAEAMNGNISKKLEKKLDKVERDREKYKQKLARQQKELQRRQQKNIYIKHNRNDPAFVGNKLKRKAAGAAGKSKLLLLGSGMSFLVIILIIIILLILIASLFSWLTPFDFSLAGDDSGEQTAASTEEEIIDGYAKS